MILKAAWVVPVAAPPIRDGYVEISASRIVGVGATSKLPSDVSDDVVELGDAVLMPGLVNPHTHLELTCYAGVLEPAPFWEWIQRLIVLRAQPGQLEREGQAVLDGAWRSLRAGVTCVGDISRRNVAWRVLKSLPIRKVCFVELLSLADHPPRNPTELRETVRSVVEDELLTVGVTAHAPYSVPADQIRATIALAAELCRPWTIHLAETREEVAFLKGDASALGPMMRSLLEQCGVTSPRRKPIELLERCLGDAPPGSLAHGNYLTDEEFGRLAAMRQAVIYCPRSHTFFAHAPHPFRRMQAAGVRVTFGTDSLASNDSLAMLDELHHVHTRVPGAPSPAELLRMATLEAARALDLDEKVGSLEVGKQADLAAFDCAADTADPIRVLIETPVPAKAVWVAGRRVI